MDLAGLHNLKAGFQTLASQGCGYLDGIAAQLQCLPSGRRNQAEGLAFGPLAEVPCGQLKHLAYQHIPV